MKHIISLKVLFLASVLIVSAIATDTYAAADTSTNPAGVCSAGQTASDGATAASDAANTWTKVCVPDAELVQDCYVYDRVIGGCFCDALASYAPRDVFIAGKTNAVKGCVPPAQEKFNGVCTKLAAKSYSCVCSDTTYKFDVKMASKTNDDDNKIGVASACVAEIVVNCQEYELALKANTFPAPFAFSNDNFNIKCRTCNDFFKKFSTDNPTGYTDGSGNTGIGCPADGSYEISSCKSMSYIAADPSDSTKFFGYQCKCDTNSQTWTQFLTSKAAPIAQACITTASFTNADDNCNLYTYNSDPTKIYCALCDYVAGAASQYRQVNFTGPNSGDLFRICTKAVEVPGCTDYYASKIPSASDSLTCYKCKTDFDYIPTSSPITINGNTMSTGFCAPKGRWIIETSLCAAYNTLTTNNDGVVTDLYLACATGSCATDPSNNKPPCYLGTSKASQYGGSCAAGALNVKAGDNADNACISTGIVQNCKTYKTITTGIASGACVQCQDGFTLVDTQLSKPSDDSTKWVPANKICLPNTLLDSNCAKYSNTDFSCIACTNGLKYSTLTKKCNVPSDSAAQCAKAVYVGGNLVCIVCASSSIIINGVCVPRIPFCSSLSTLGVCSACIGGFQLINNQCIQKPANCDQINEKGVCVQCKSGLAPNSDGKCVSSNFNGQNLCPAGQVLSNGACVPVKVKIDGCLQYKLDSTCDQCVQGKRPSSDGSACVDATDRPGAKPCPPNTNKVIYKRNPSDPLGDCVAVDVSCANARDDGFCIGCKNGEYAHTDGKCYKVFITEDGGN